MQFRLVPQFDYLDCLSLSVATDRSTSLDGVVQFVDRLKVFRDVLNTTFFGYSKLTHSLREDSWFMHQHSDHESATHAVVVQVTENKTGKIEYFFVEYK